MEKDYPPSLRPLWQILSRELFAFAAAGVLYPIGIKRSKRRTARKRDLRTVVLVHGYLGNRSNFLPLYAYLKARGVRVLSFNYPSSLGAEHGALLLKNYLKKNVRGGRIDLVCHSVGGLVSRIYLQELGGSRRVDRCITIGTPHRGTYNAYWLASKVGRELRPDSALLKRIESTREMASTVRFTSIVAGSDNIVIPRIFASNENTVHLPDLGHISVLFSLKAFRVVAECLSLKRETNLFPTRKLET